MTETGRVRPDTRQERVVGVPGVTSLLITSTSRGAMLLLQFVFSRDPVNHYNNSTAKLNILI